MMYKFRWVRASPACAALRLMRVRLPSFLGLRLTYMTFASGIYCHLWCAHGMSSQAEHAITCGEHFFSFLHDVWWLSVNICPSVNSLNSLLTCQHCCLGTFADTSAQSARTSIGRSSLINMQKQITHFTSLSVSAALNQRWPKGVTMPSRASPTG